MMRAVIDERLGARIVSERPLVYSRAAAAGDRPDFVRAASGLAAWRGGLAVVQDDASFIAIVRGDDVDALAIPYAPGGRRRFEVALGNKLDKLDLESCVVIAGELLALGSGSIAGVRDRICRVRPDRAIVELVDAGALYASLRAAIGGAINIEGAACVGDELWLFHRGNTGAADRPAIARVELAAFRAYLADGAPPAIRTVARCELGEHAGVRFGFTDATTRGDRVVVACATEAAADAIADGAVGAVRLGVIDGDVIRCAPLPARKIEGLAFANDRLWATIDSDDATAPAPLCEVELRGPWE